MNAPKGIKAARPGPIDVAKDFEVVPWGTIATFEGTCEQLVNAGVAFQNMFENLGKTGCKTDDDGYGNQYKVQLLRGRRYPEGTFRLELKTAEDPLYGDPANSANHNSKWWLSVGASVDAELAKVLQDMRAPRKELH